MHTIFINIITSNDEAAGLYDEECRDYDCNESVRKDIHY